jgi:hypothetical protein
MALSGSTERTVRELWEIGARYGRPPLPTPEADPWEEDDPLDPQRDVVVVEMPGRPSITVRLYPGVEDTVTVEDTMDLEVPRHDTAAVVESILAGRCWVRPGVGRGLSRLVWTFLRTTMAAVLMVPVGTGARARTYEVGVAYALGQGVWLASLPTEPGDGPRGRGRSQDRPQGQD